MTPRRIISLDVDDLVRALRRIPLLEDTPERELADIAMRAHILAFDDGEVIVPEGEEGLGFYVVMSGRARVVRDGRVVNRLEQGEFFGEIALLENAGRTATVVAEGAATCLGILRTFFRPLLVRNPRLALRILDEEAKRLS
jgi:CRP-like cAMP-binding protein